MQLTVLHIKVVHTMVFAVLSACVAYVLMSGAFNRITPWTWGAIAAIVVEGLVLAASGGRCPLTALDGIESVRKHSSKDAQYTRKHSTAKQPFFVLNSTNGETIGSSQMYASVPAMESGIASVKENGATKTSKDKA